MPDPFAHNVLLIAPHPDDELVGLGGILVRRAVLPDTRTTILHLTSGTPILDTLDSRSYSQRAKERRSQASIVAAALNAEHVLLDHASRSLVNTWGDVLASIERLVHRQQYDIWVPALEGGHPDHDIAAALGRSIAKRCSLSVAEYRLYQWSTTGRTVFARNAWRGCRIITLPAAHQRRKRALMRVYETEFKRILRAVPCYREVLGPIGSFCPAALNRGWTAWFDEPDPARIAAAIEEICR